MLATTDDLYALGVLSSSSQASAERSARADVILGMVSAQVVAGLGYVDEDALRAVCTDTQLVALSAVVAEAAGQRLNSINASPDYPSGDPTALLNRRHWRSIRSILQMNQSSSSVVIERGDDSWLTVTGVPVPGFDWAPST